MPDAEFSGGPPANWRDLLRALSVVPAPPWPRLLALASGVLGGSPLRFASPIEGTWVHPPPRGEPLAQQWGAPWVEGSCRMWLGHPHPSAEEVFRVLVCHARARAAEASYASLRDESFEAMCIHEAGRLIEVNSAYASLFGYSREEMLGMHMSATISPVALPRIEELVQSGYQGAYETEALLRDGTTVPLEARAKALHFRGKPARIASFRDLRAEKAHEEVLERARRRAEDADRQKTAFLGDVSHELRTPLNAVLGIAHLLEQTAMDADQTQLLRELESSAQDLLVLLNDLLDVSRIAEGRVELRVRPFAVRSLMQAVLRSVRPPHDGVDLRMHIDPGCEGVWLGDDLRIRQILTNLVDNAAKFTHEGHIDFQVSLGATGLCWWVRDSGVGIAPERQQRLFHRFAPGDEAQEYFGGSGLGLYISHELAQRMGGTLRLSSTMGEGSLFMLELPLPRGHDEHTRTAEVKNPQREPPLRILVAEDTRVNQFVIRRLLESRGHEVVVAHHGEEALALVRHSAFDLVLMDVQMPVMDGLKATQAMRARAIRTPVYALTANAHQHDLAHCLDVGMNGWLSKPVEPHRLAEVLKRVARARGVHAAGEASAEAPTDKGIVEPFFTEGRGRPVSGDELDVVAEGEEALPD